MKLKVQFKGMLQNYIVSRGYIQKDLIADAAVFEELCTQDFSVWVHTWSVSKHVYHNSRCHWDHMLCSVTLNKNVTSQGLACLLNVKFEMG
jgi:hypothetical protein